MSVVLTLIKERESERPPLGGRSLSLIRISTSHDVWVLG